MLAPRDRAAPDFAEAHSTLAVSLQFLGRIDEAVAHHRRAIALAPDDASLHSNLLYLLNYLPGIEPAVIFAEHRGWASAACRSADGGRGAHANDRSPTRRLKVGYVSPYFRDHAVNFFVEPILASSRPRNSSRCFAIRDVARPTRRPPGLRAMPTSGARSPHRRTKQLADIVRDDGIDILVDLTGHIAGAPDAAFARNPAPVQVTYIGYQNTTGMAAMDYRLTDAYADPPGATDAWLHGKAGAASADVLLLSAGPRHAASGAVACRGKRLHHFRLVQQLHQGYARPSSTAWAAILRGVAGSRLLLLRRHDRLAASAAIVEAFARHGIDRERIELASRLSPRRVIAN